jgi:hypothetical protein
VPSLALGASPGESLLNDCELVDRAGITDQQNVSRVVCIGFVLASLSYYRAESLFAQEKNQTALAKNTPDVASLRSTPSSFCYPVDPSREVQAIDAVVEARGLARYLRSLPPTSLKSSHPGDDVRMRLFWSYMQAEYPCDQYFMTFGPEAKKYRPKAGQ